MKKLIYSLAFYAAATVATAQDGISFVSWNCNTESEVYVVPLAPHSIDVRLSIYKNPQIVGDRTVKVTVITSISFEGVHDTTVQTFPIATTGTHRIRVDCEYSSQGHPSLEVGTYYQMWANGVPSSEMIYIGPTTLVFQTPQVVLHPCAVTQVDNGSVVHGQVTATPYSVFVECPQYQTYMMAGLYEDETGQMLALDSLPQYYEAPEWDYSFDLPYSGPETSACMKTWVRVQGNGEILDLDSSEECNLSIGLAPTGIGTHSNSDDAVYGADGAITIRAIKTGTYRVMSLQGSLVRSGSLQAGQNIVSVEEGGYLVEVVRKDMRTTIQKVVVL